MVISLSIGRDNLSIFHIFGRKTAQHVKLGVCVCVCVCYLFLIFFIVVEALEKPRQPLPHLEAVYFMVPSEEVCVCVAMHLHINFTFISV